MAPKIVSMSPYGVLDAPQSYNPLNDHTRRMKASSMNAMFFDSVFAKQVWMESFDFNMVNISSRAYVPHPHPPEVTIPHCGDGVGRVRLGWAGEENKTKRKNKTENKRESRKHIKKHGKTKKD